LCAGGRRGKKKTGAAGSVGGGEGVGGRGGGGGGASGAVAPEGGARPPADRAGADAAALLHAAMVWAGRRGVGRCALRQPGTARLYRHRSGGGVGSGRDDGAALPALAGASRSDPGTVRGGRGDAGGARRVD